MKSFHFLGKAGAGLYLVCFKVTPMGRVRRLSVQLRCVAFLLSVSQRVRALISEENRRTPLGCWWIDDDGEVAFRFETTLASRDWKEQVHFALSFSEALVPSMLQRLRRHARGCLSRIRDPRDTAA